MTGDCMKLWKFTLYVGYFLWIFHTRAAHSYLRSRVVREPHQRIPPHRNDPHGHCTVSSSENPERLTPRARATGAPSPAPSAHVDVVRIFRVLNFHKSIIIPAMGI